MAKITPIHKELKTIPQFEISNISVEIFTTNLLSKQLSRMEKFRLAKLFSDRLLDKPEYDQTS